MHHLSQRFLAIFGGMLLVLSLALVYSPDAAHAASKLPIKRPRLATPIGNNYTTATPSIYNFGGQLYVAFSGNDYHIYITQSSNGINFPNPVKLTDTTAGGTGPQMTSFNGHLYLAWDSSSGDGFIYFGWYNGTSTLQGHGRFYANSCSGLGMTTLNNTLYIAYRECNSSNDYIDFASGVISNGVLIFSTIRDPHDATEFAPALTTSNVSGTPLVYIAWRGTNGSHSVYLGSYPGYGDSITPMHVVTYDCSSSDMGIAPDPDGIGLDLAWIGCTNDYIFTGYYNGPWNVTGLYALSTQSLNIPAETGPGLCTSFGHLYVAWGDPSTGRLEITQFK